MSGFAIGVILALGLIALYFYIRSKVEIHMTIEEIVDEYDNIIAPDKVEPKEVQEVKEVEVSKENLETTKVNKTKTKRSWYNDGKTQKLLTETEISELSKDWKKGRIPKKPKTPKRSKAKTTKDK